MTTASRTISPLDHLIVGFDKALRVVGGVAKAGRPNPGVSAPDCELNAQEHRHSAGISKQQELALPLRLRTDIADR